MAKAEVRTRKSNSVKSKSKAVPARKPRATKAVASRTDKSFMLKDGKPESGAILIVTNESKQPMPKLRSKAKPKARAKTAVVKTPVQAAAKAVAPDMAVTLSAPLPRSQAPVVWQKAGPTDNFRFWVRSVSKGMINMLRHGRKTVPPTQAPIGAKLRTKNDLLREIAALRQENALMRDRLGLPRAAFGRQVAETI